MASRGRAVAHLGAGVVPFCVRLLRKSGPSASMLRRTTPRPALGCTISGSLAKVRDRAAICRYRTLELDETRRWTEGGALEVVVMVAGERDEVCLITDLSKTFWQG